ncbi:MAG: YCF48-related protein [candidate division WOR-3 bacterium]|nr:YCF48-related protein [candidate division WOR-3 bacterium]
MNKENVILFILLFTYTFAGWAPQISGTNASLNDVYFPGDTLTGYICGDSGIILKTTNSGIDWIRQNTPVSTKLNAIYFIGDSGWCVGNHATMLMTIDGGLSWEGDSGDSLNFYID